MMPALRPAADSTAAGDRPAWLELDMYVCPIRCGLGEKRVEERTGELYLIVNTR